LPSELKNFNLVTGKPLFIAPKGRTWKEFVDESKAHGWPSFRDEEIVWENVRALGDGEAVSLSISKSFYELFMFLLAGTHLGHNLPDKKGNRYCINLCSIAGKPQNE
jgi:peptide methionine sulfoxide reductase MsrB